MTSKSDLTARDIEILSLAFQCLKDPKAVNVDYVKLAQAGNFKNAKSANAAFCVVRKKLDAASPTTIDPSSPSKPSLKNEKDETLSNDSNAADTEETPKAMYPPPKKARAPRKPKPAKSAVKVEVEGDEETPAGFSALTAAGAAPGTEGLTSGGGAAKPKRKYSSKPKDPNAPSPAAKKAKKASANAAAAGDLATTPTVADGGTDELSNLNTSEAQIAAEDALVVDVAV